MICRSIIWMMKILTGHKVAYESPDHIFPWGTKRDNTTDLGFIVEIEAHFRHKKIKTLDVGCAGGQLTIDFMRRGHEAVGIEGSDYNVKNGRANWPDYHNAYLFTADATKPYQVVSADDKPVTLDLITAWEVIEHIHPDDLDAFFTNITKHMGEDSIFCGSISTVPSTEGRILHQSVFPKEVWINEILNKHFSVIEEYPFQSTVRNPCESNFHILLKL